MSVKPGEAQHDPFSDFLFSDFLTPFRISDISPDGWLAKEYGRLAEVAADRKIDPSAIDRIFVVDRGIINPPRKQGKIVDANSDLLFLELFLHVTEFVQREKGRRPPIDWRIYALPKSRGWEGI